MLAVNTILHPTDFSERSQYAFWLACSLARVTTIRLPNRGRVSGSSNQRSLSLSRATSPTRYARSIAHLRLSEERKASRNVRVKTGGDGVMR